MPTKRITPESWKVCLHKRSQNIYGGMKKRADKIHMAMPFTLAEFRDWLDRKLGRDGIARCEYSGEVITAEDFSVDHRQPVSRGGDFALANLALCAEKHNLRKGNMSAREYELFMTHVTVLYPAEVQAAIWRKLEVGDVQRFSHYRRLKKQQAGR